MRRLIVFLCRSYKCALEVARAVGFTEKLTLLKVFGGLHGKGYFSGAGEVMSMEKHAAYSWSSYSWEVL